MLVIHDARPPGFPPPAGSRAAAEQISPPRRGSSGARVYIVDATIERGTVCIVGPRAAK